MSIYEYDEEKHMQQERRDAKEEGRVEGRIEGRTEGNLQKEISLICKKLRKGKDVSQISEDLEEDTSYIEALCNIIQEYAPDYDEENILRAVMAKR